jgi:hypothetical protein
MYADAGAMQLVRWPKQFDVIVTDNLFGDILSDCAAMLTGSLGMLPSASLGNKNANGKLKAMYEPVHGSAPDISGKGLANPIACILSFSMALRYTFDLKKEADLLDKSVERVLHSGIRTADLLQKKDKKPASTREVCNTLSTDLSNKSASFFKSKVYLKAIEKLRMQAMGLANPLPEISGADPCTGSYIAFNFPLAFLFPKLADGNIPKLPVSIAAQSDNMSPNKLSVTITSNCFGHLTNCIAPASAYI